MGTVSYALCRGLDLVDVARVAEFFDGSMDDVRRFLQEVWLPDASRTLQAIVAEADVSLCERLAFLCDHLREGARTVGARPILHAADLIERALELNERDLARTIASATIPTLCYVSTQLSACA